MPTIESTEPSVGADYAAILQAKYDDFVLFLSTQSGHAESTIRNYAGRIRKYLTYCTQRGFNGAKSWNEYIHYTFAEFADQRLHKMQVFNANKNALNYYLQYLYNVGVIEELIRYTLRWNPTNQMLKDEFSRRLERKTNYLEKSEVNKLLNYCFVRDPRLYITIFCMYNLGLRANDIASLTRSSLIQVHHKSGGKKQWMIQVYGKTERVRRKIAAIAVPDGFAKMILCYMDEAGLTMQEDAIIANRTFNRDYSYTKRVDNKPIASIKPKAIALLVKSVCDKVFEGRQLTSHYMRRSRATNLLTDGHDYFKVSKLLRMSPSTLINHYDLRFDTHGLSETFINTDLLESDTILSDYFPNV